MKKCVFAIYSLILLLLFSACSKDSDSLTGTDTETVDITFGYVNKTNIRSRDVDLVPTAVVITILQGIDTVHNAIELPVQSFNGSFVTQPLPLLVGTYSITEFKLINASNEVIMAAPKEGSTAALLVDIALDIEFTVSKNGSNAIVPEVLSTEGFTAKDFGYSSLGFTQISTMDFLLGVQAFDDITGVYTFVDANIVITTDGRVDFNEPIPAETKAIRIRDNATATYVISITKEDYRDTTLTFTNTELKAFDGVDAGEIPLLVVLSKNTSVVNENLFYDNGTKAVYLKWDGKLRQIDNTVWDQLYASPVDPAQCTQFNSNESVDGLPEFSANSFGPFTALHKELNSDIFYFVDAMPWDVDNPVIRKITVEQIVAWGFNESKVQSFAEGMMPYDTKAIPVSVDGNNMNIAFHFQGLHNLYGNYSAGTPNQVNPYFAPLQAIYPYNVGVVESTKQAISNDIVANWHTPYYDLMNN